MSDLYYDPYDQEIDTDPYPIWRRMREETPLYYNEKYDFFALSRFDDVRAASVVWQLPVRKGLGARDDPQRGAADEGDDPLRGPAGCTTCTGPAQPRVHARGACTRSSRRSARFCARASTRWSGQGGSTSSADLGADADADHRHDARHPRAGPAAAATTATGARLDEGGQPASDARRSHVQCHRPVQRVHRVAGDHPSDDLMTDLLNAEFEDETGTDTDAHP